VIQKCHKSPFFAILSANRPTIRDYFPARAVLITGLLVSSPGESPMQRSPEDSFSGFSIDLLENA
jgi:hypothetical protein